MKKLISLLLALLMITTLFTLASCNKDKNEEDDGDAVKVIEIPLTDEEYAFAVQKGNTELLTKLNAFLAKINENGTFNEIANKYFGDGTPRCCDLCCREKDRWLSAHRCHQCGIPSL